MDGALRHAAGTRGVASVAVPSPRPVEGHVAHMRGAYALCVGAGRGRKARFHYARQQHWRRRERRGRRVKHVAAAGGLRRRLAPRGQC
eukprot:3268771-Pleurochrysis_carterae.AAC.1